MARPPGTRIRVAVLHPTKRAVIVYGNDIGRHPDDGRIAVNCDDGRAPLRPPRQREVHRARHRANKQPRPSSTTQQLV